MLVSQCASGHVQDLSWICPVGTAGAWPGTAGRESAVELE